MSTLSASFGALRAKFTQLLRNRPRPMPEVEAPFRIRYVAWGMNDLLSTPVSTMKLSGCRTRILTLARPLEIRRRTLLYGLCLVNHLDEIIASSRFNQGPQFVQPGDFLCMKHAIIAPEPVPIEDWRPFLADVEPVRLRSPRDAVKASFSVTHLTPYDYRLLLAELEKV
jgi:hypothetical protein